MKVPELFTGQGQVTLDEPFSLFKIGKMLKNDGCYVICLAGIVNFLQLSLQFQRSLIDRHAELFDAAFIYSQNRLCTKFSGSAHYSNNIFDRNCFVCINYHSRLIGFFRKQGLKFRHQFFVGTSKVTMEELVAKLQPLLAKETDQPTVVINADKTVPVENIVAVMRAARELGAKTVLAVDKSGVK